MNFLKETTRQGFTLVEVVVALGISSIIIASTASIFLRFTSEFKDKTIKDREMNYINEALAFIEHELNDNNSSVVLENNILNMYKSDGIHMNRINLNNSGNLFIFYFSYGNLESSNPIMNDIMTFKLEKRNNIFYVSIISKNGEKGERCIGIETL